MLWYTEYQWLIIQNKVSINGGKFIELWVDSNQPIIQIVSGCLVSVA